MENNILTVSQINEYVYAKLEHDPFLNYVSVRGEISNYKLYPSGHHYFTLKDPGSQLRCVLFRGNAVRLRFRPDNGMKVVVYGKLTVYQKDGTYQLYCTGLTMDGIGDLYAAFEKLKQKLDAMGLFADGHKRPLPLYPNRIGIVTSSAGAAVHDILRILRKRYPIVKVLLLPVRVQGAEAPGEIAAAIEYANKWKLADLLIVGRGGGSLEDLWAFNEEIVAHAIYQSEIPIISAVGHEPDVTIADYIADKRAATPTNGAELAVPDSDNIRQNLDGISSRLQAVMALRLQSYRQRLQYLSHAEALSSPRGFLEIRKSKLQNLSQRLTSSEISLIQKDKERFVHCAAKLDAMSPLKVLARGYAIATKEDDSVIRSCNQVRDGEKIYINVEDGSFRAVVRQEEG